MAMRIPSEKRPYAKPSDEAVVFQIEEPEASAPVKATDLRAQLLNRFQSPGYRPPVVPSVAMELLELARRPDVQVEEVVSLLERDQLLAGRALKAVNSPFYAVPNAIRSLKQALVLLGLNTVRDIVLDAALHLRVFRAEGYAQEMETLQRHSLAVAHLSRTVCRYTSLDAEFAFICGLLHDVGIAACLLALADTPANERPTELEGAWGVIDDVHEDASALLANLWKLPQQVGMVIGHHHSWKIDGVVHPLCAAVGLADILVRCEGLPERGLATLQVQGVMEREEERRRDQAAQVLGLDRTLLKRIGDEARALCSRLSPAGLKA